MMTFQGYPRSLILTPVKARMGLLIGPRQ